MKSIGIVGGSVIGLSTAAAILQETPNVKIVVYSDKFSPHTTADVSAGIIYPHAIGEDNDENTIRKWTIDTAKHLVKFASENGKATEALSIASGYKLWKHAQENYSDPYEDCIFGRRDVPEDELDQLFSKGRYAHAEFLTAFVCDCSIYLPCLMRKLEANGVEFVQKRITSLGEVADMGHDIVVNTTGFDAKFLVGDTKMQPNRGQVLLVKAPWIRHLYLEVDDESYIIPKSDYLVVGGTHDKDASISLDKDASNRIWTKACEMIPSLRNGRVIGERVGIRPLRSSIRIEIEQATSHRGKKYAVLHHYGHGGSGVTVHWGSSTQAATLLKAYLDQHARL